MSGFICVTLATFTYCATRQAARAVARNSGKRWGEYAVLVANPYDSEAEFEAIAAAKVTLHARAVFEAALARIESASIRAWAQTAHNRPLLVKLAANILRKDARDAETKLATLILCNAIGL